jgi:phage gp45-like
MRGYHPQVALGEIVKIDDSGKQQTVDHHGIAGQQHSEVYRAQYFGLSSNPPKKSTGFFIGFGGEQNRAVFIGGEHDDYRPTGLKEGETKSYDKTGNTIHFQNDDGVTHTTKKGDTTHTTSEGKLSISAKKDSSLSISDGKYDVKAKKDSKYEISDGKLTLKAKNDIDVNMDGKVNLGESHINGDATVSKNLAVSQLLSAAGGLSTGALEVASDPDGGLVQCTMGLEVTGTADMLGDIVCAGDADIAGKLTCDVVKTAGFTVADLNTAYPPASNAGARAYVTDATATTFYSTLSGGGSNVVPAFCDGVNWLVG